MTEDEAIRQECKENMKEKDKIIEEDKMIEPKELRDDYSEGYQQATADFINKVELYFAKCMLNKRVPRFEELKQMLVEK
jgi:hypothetical protein